MFATPSEQQTYIRAVRSYIDEKQSIRRSEQLFVSWTEPRKGQPVTKQRFTHYIIESAGHILGLHEGRVCSVCFWPSVNSTCMTCLHRVCSYCCPGVLIRTWGPSPLTISCLISCLAIQELPYPIVRHQAKILKKNAAFIIAWLQFLD